MRRLAHLLILVTLISCGAQEVLKKEHYTPGSVEGTVVRVEDRVVQVRRFNDNQVVVLRVRSAEGIYIGDRVQVTEGVVKKITAGKAKR